MAAQSVTNPARHVLITGPPGVGKTTLMCKVCALLKDRHGVPVSGFYTEEVRGGVARGRGSRIGFDVVTLDGKKRGPLARVEGAAGLSATATRNSIFVGRYCVDVEAFESLSLPVLSVGSDQAHRSAASDDVAASRGGSSDQLQVVLIDEIGKMELFSRDFVECVRSLFESTANSGDSSYLGVILFASIPITRPGQKSHWLVERLRKRKDCKLYEVSKENRDGLVEEIAKFILQTLKLQ